MISVSNIHKKYKKSVVLNDISFSAKAGECIGILGENGSGKSTLLSIMAGTLSADSGSVIIEKGHSCGYVPQDNPLIPELSVKDNLKLWYGNEIPPLIDELGISEFINKNVNQLSGGMKKRLSIAVAMAEHPDILLLDEPSAALDLPCKQIIRDYLENFCKNGGTVIIATHDEMELEICSRLLVISKGACKTISNTLRGKELILELTS